MNDFSYDLPRSFYIWPDQSGFYGDFGGTFVPEILRNNIQELKEQFDRLKKDDGYWAEYVSELQSFSGRPTPVTHARRLSDELGGAQIYLKREDLNQTGAHKINNVIGQGLLVKRLGKKRVIAETGAGQHGMATATMAARYGLKATIYMGEEDVERQRPNVFWMEQMGAEVCPVTDGTKTLKDAINQAMRDWSENYEDTHYVLGTACGPHPFPAMVAYFQSVIGFEARQQIQKICGRLPDKVYACVGGGSNALGIFQAFIPDANVELVGMEAGGVGNERGQHAARFLGNQGTVGVSQGYKTLFLQDDDGQMLDTCSVAAGLDYVGVAPYIAHLHSMGRVEMQAANDEEVIQAVKMLMQTEGIISALESAHGLAGALQAARQMNKEEIVLVNLSGRGDKDIFTIAEAFKDPSWNEFLKYKAKDL